MPRTISLFIALIVWPIAQTPTPTPTPTYDALRAKAIRTCEAIDAGDYQSGLALNPDGFRSFYVRSACFQKAAEQFRDPTLCDRVRRRWSLFSSSWGYAPENCRKLVSVAIEADRAEFGEIRRRHSAGSMVLRDFRIERNGNGRDYDVVPSFAGTDGHGYTLTIEIVPAGGRPVSIHSGGYFVDPRSELRLFVRQQEIKAKLPAFQPGQLHSVRMTATFTLPTGGGSRFLSDAFLESVFPVVERIRSVTRDVRF